MKLFKAILNLIAAFGLTIATASAEEEAPGMVKMCLFYPTESGHARSDPILNQSCPSDHVHTFYGPQNFHPNTSYQQLRDTKPQHSSTPFVENQSLYWHPSIYQVTQVNGQQTYTRVNNLETSPYYRWNTNTLPETVAFPPDFRMIAYSNQQGAEVGGETGGNLLVECCNYINGGEEENCSTTVGNPLIFPTNTCDFLGIAFSMPTCWDESKGIGTDDPFGHVTYTTDGTVGGPCPSGYNKRIPQVQLFVRINQYKGGTYQLSDGSDVFHVDFMNGWQEGKLQEIIRDCAPSGEPGYNPPCDCDQFLTPNTNPAPAVCDDDVKQFILDEETAVVTTLPRGTCRLTSLIPKSWEVDPPFLGTCDNSGGGSGGNDDEGEDDDEEPDNDADDEIVEWCADSQLKLKLAQGLFDCEWVSENFESRCNKPGIRQHCPVTCDAPEYCGEDSVRRFALDENESIIRRCAWVENNAEVRCSMTDMCNTCRKTCANYEGCIGDVGAGNDDEETDDEERYRILKTSPRLLRG